MTRRSLRDRNRAAIALDADVPALDDSLPTPEAVAPTVTPPPTRPVAPKKAGPKPGGVTSRLGVYLTADEFADAKAAYLADWTNGGQADTFGRWIAAAVDRYAALDPAQRAGAQPKGRSDERTGSTRSFDVAAETMTRMREAINTDHQAGRWPSASAWCAEAIAHAVGEARTRNGGMLPTPPARLPNRLIR